MLAAEPFQISRAGDWSARPNEKLNFQGTSPDSQMAFNRCVAASALCPPERNTIPGTAAGTERRKHRRVASTTSPISGCCGQSAPDKIMPVLRSISSSTTRYQQYWELRTRCDGANRDFMIRRRFELFRLSCVPVSKMRFDSLEAVNASPLTPTIRQIWEM